MIKIDSNLINHVLIEELNIQEDHVHVLVKVLPKDSVSNYIGIQSRGEVL